MLFSCLTLLAAVLTIWLAPFFVLVGVTAIAAIRAASKPEPLPDRTRPIRFHVLVPAHDEAALIAASVHSLLAIDYPREAFQVIILADNCSDDTAALARAAGATVWERQDTTLRGKGHALAWGIDKLRREARVAGTDAVVIVDADIVASRGLLWAFAAQLQQGRSFVQGLYTGANPDVSWRTQLLTYALALINGVWLIAQEQLGMSVGLRGNGMAFTLAGLSRQPWAEFGLAEDLEYSWRLRLAKERVHFSRAAHITAQLVSQGGSAAESQRQRWEHGRRSIRQSYRPKILAAKHLPVGKRLYYLLDLYMQPLAKLAAWQAVALVMAAVSGAAGLVGLQLLGFGLLALYAATPFLLLGLPARYLLAVRYLPVYVLWKLRLFGQKAPKDWIRTGRE